MPQDRYGEFGSLFNHEGIRKVFQSMSAHRPRVIAGMVPLIEVVIPTPVDRFIISAGFAITGDGILIEFQETEEVAFGTPAAATQRTIVLKHTLGLVAAGNGATVELEAGFLKTSVDGTILGWIDYPGGNVPLTDEHITATTPMLDTPLAAEYLDDAYPVVEQNAPHAFILDDPANHVDLVRTVSQQDVKGDGFLYWTTEIENTNLAPQTWIGWLVLRTKAVHGLAQPYFHVDMALNTDTAGIAMEAQIAGQTTALFPAGQAPTPAAPWVVESVDIPPNVRPDVGGVLMLKLTAVLASTDKAWLADMVVTARPLMYTP